MGRCAHRRHPECEGPSFFPEDRKHLENSDFITMNQASGEVCKILSERLNSPQTSKRDIDNSANTKSHYGHTVEGTADF